MSTCDRSPDLNEQGTEAPTVSYHVCSAVKVEGLIALPHALFRLLHWDHLRGTFFFRLPIPIRPPPAFAEGQRRQITQEFNKPH